jgi:molybdopterin synthase sulfur carrier subunit
MKTKVLLFGPLTDICNSDHIMAEMTADIHSLVDQLKKTYPTLKTVVFAIAVNNQIINENIPLREHDTVSLLPPFSGG